MSFCIKCVNASKNTGRPKSAKTFAVPVMMLAVALEANDGTEFEFDCATPLDPAALLALINEADASKRLYPVNGLENFDAPRADNITETFNSGNLSLIARGIRSMSFVLPETTPQYSAQISNLGECGEAGVYFVDACGNILGNGRVAGKLKPFRVARNTWSSILMWATDTTGTNTNVNFNLNRLELDKDVAYITEGTYTADVLAAEGLLDVSIDNPTASAATDTVDLEAKTIFDDHCDMEGIKGLVAVDFTIVINLVTTTIIDVAEGVNGAYVITVSDDLIAAETGTITIAKDGLETATAAVTVGA